jgi:hypothetical protein
VFIITGIVVRIVSISYFEGLWCFMHSLVSEGTLSSEEQIQSCYNLLMCRQLLLYFSEYVTVTPLL